MTLRFPVPKSSPRMAAQCTAEEAGTGRGWASLRAYGLVGHIPGAPEQELLPL